MSSAKVNPAGETWMLKSSVGSDDMDELALFCLHFGAGISTAPIFQPEWRSLLQTAPTPRG